MDKLRLGIIGYGKMGANHYRNILAGECPEIEVTAIADIDPVRLEAAKVAGGGENCAKCGRCTVPNVDAALKEGCPALFDDAIKMMDSALVDAVLICVPHYDHPKYAQEAFARGLHVMCEKPAGVYTKQVREMNEAAAKSDVVFGMMFNQRTNCVYRKMRELIQSGKYGQIRRTNWLITDWYRTQNYYDSGDWRATWSGEGGGVLLNQCPHQLDLWQWICGMPTKVYAKMAFGRWHDIEVEDDVSAFVEYPNGATGVFVTTTGDGLGTNRFEVQMDSAKLVIEGGVLRVWEFDVPEPVHRVTCTAGFTPPPSHEIKVETDGLNPQHVGVLNAFADAILHGGSLVADGEEGLNGLILSNAMHLSAWMGEEISLPLDEELFYDELMKRVATSRRKNTGKSATDDPSDTHGA